MGASVVVAADRFGVEVLELARLDAGALDEGLDLVRSEADDPPEAVGRQIAVVDEPVERAGGDAETPGSLLGRQPLGLVRAWGCIAGDVVVTSRNAR